MQVSKLLNRLNARCAIGFTYPQKVVLLGCGTLYVLCPLDLDFIPLLGWIDDAYVLRLLYRVWRSPTLPGRPPSGGAAGRPSWSVPMRGKAVPA